MTTVARLSADLVANNTSFESSLQRANRSMSQAQQSWNSSLNRASRSFDSFDTHVRRSIGSIGDLKTQLGGIATAVAGALSVQKIIAYSDTWKQLEGRLKIIEGSMEGVAQAQETLFEIAQRTRQPLESVTQLYTKLNTALGDNKRLQYDVAGITETVALALAVTGEGSAQAASAILQFSQAVSSDFKASAQEINSLLDSAPRLALALQQAMGDGSKSLKQLAADGELSTERVLRALEPLAEQGREIRGEFAEMGLTVSQSLTQLDNAFLKFIGQTGAIQSGSTSLALGIKALADNFGTLATGVTAVAALIAAKYISAITLAGIASVKSFTQTALAASVMNTAVTTSMTRMAGLGATVSYTTAAVNGLSLSARAAAVGVAGLTAASTTLGAGLALIGGPLGLAAIAAMGLMAAESAAAGRAQAQVNAVTQQYTALAAEYISAENSRRQAIRESTLENIQNMKLELQAQQELFKAYQDKSFLGRFVQNLRLPGTEGNGVRAIAGRGAALADGIDELERLMQQYKAMDGAAAGAASGGGGSGGKSKKDALKDIMDGLKEETRQLEIQTQMYGAKETAIERAQQAFKIENQLRQAGITLSKTQQAEIDKYLDSIEKQNDLLEQQEKIQKEVEDRERDRREAINQLGATFESAFERAITDGEKLSDVLQGILDDILKIITRVTITEPLGNAITDIFSGSGGSGGIFGNLFSTKPSLAVGTDYVMRDTTANIHRGEAIVPASEVRAMRGGSDVSVIINNNSNAQVSTQTQQNGNGLELTVMIDQAVADNIGRPGSKTNGALKAMQNRALVRR